MKTKYGWLLMAAVLSSAGCAKQQVEGYFEVNAALETTPVASKDDAADDPAIWVHPTTPELSVIIGTNKQQGLILYDLDGKVLAEYLDGELNNVDVRDNFVVSENRTTNQMVVYTMDPETRLLTRIDRDQPIVESGVYGSGLYMDRETETLYSFVGSKSGLVTQIRHHLKSDGTVTGEVVREIQVPSQVEGIVADDRNHTVYIGEEVSGIWKYDARPESGNNGKQIYTINKEGPIWKEDIEGLSLFYLNDEEGYLVASAQGHNRYVLFDRQAPHEFITTFAVVDGLIDGTQETDGLDVTNLPLGDKFPMGALVVQDGKNPGSTQNFKVIDWNEIVNGSAGTVKSNPAYDPR